MLGLREIGGTLHKRKAWLVVLAFAILALALAVLQMDKLSGGRLDLRQAIFYGPGPIPQSGIDGSKLPVVEEDDSCDYGRNPEKIWLDSPDGHAFERAFCDGNTEAVYKHPLDTPENEGLYCDEVPGCWAYGLN